MKKRLKLLLIVFFTAQLSAQESELQLVSTAGETANNATIEIAYSIGEPFYISNSNETISLTEGFIQTESEIEPNAINITESIKLSLFPNPSKEYVNIKIDEFKANTYTLEIYSVLGKLIFKQNLEEQTTIDVSKYSVGSYQFKISNKKRKQNNFYKLLKIK